VRVFLVDEHEIVRRGVTDLLSDAGGVTVVGEAGSAAAARARVPAARPDLVVLEIRLPDGNGVDLCRELRALLPGLRTTTRPGRRRLSRAPLPSC
jgi:DNA-binding NarL/FixJ family response regulator